MAECTIKVKLITHLMTCPRSRDDYVFPVEMTQAGMASALGIGRTHAGNELRKLVEEGCVEFEKAYIDTGTRRMIVYKLTPVGRSLGRRFTAKLGGKSASESRGGSPREDTREREGVPHEQPAGFQPPLPRLGGSGADAAKSSKLLGAARPQEGVSEH